MDTAVSSRYRNQWYESPHIPLSEVARHSVDKAKHRASRHQKRIPLPGQVIAELSFDFWTYLFIERYPSMLWPLIQNQLHTTRVTTTSDRAPRIIPPLEEFRSEMDVAYRLQNRYATSISNVTDGFPLRHRSGSNSTPRVPDLRYACP